VQFKPFMPRLILASSSPRRRELLRVLKLEFEIRSVDLDETPLEEEDPRSYVTRLATAKAQHVLRPNELVLAADTIVVLDGQILGKPRDTPDAVRMLRLLSDREHLVLTGVALADGSKQLTEAAIASTEVTFGRIEQQEIDWYVETGEPLDKAGAYAVQGLGSLFVKEIRGTHSNVVGLPVPTMAFLFRQLGYRLQEFTIDDRPTRQAPSNDLPNPSHG
jgi:septum formation protein